MAEKLGILVGGGPAPGINSVIASATIEACNRGLDVVGIFDGYRELAAGRIPETMPLNVDYVARLHGSGGSMLRTSRTNPAASEASLDNCSRVLTDLGIRYLVAIGGDDTTYGAARIAERTKGAIGVATVPKTIDNDLPLPDNAPTFGFETARAVGTGIVESLIEDARSTARWYLVVTMGRKSGALALGICKAAGAALAVIPEEFAPGQLDLSMLVDTIAGAIVKRRAQGRPYGVAVLAEGLIERVAPEELAALNSVSRDAYGHVRLADVPIGSILRDRVRDALSELGIDTTVLTKDVGYELRCARPIPFDLDYTRTLGYGAVRYLLEGGSGSLIALTGGHVTALSLPQLVDAQTGRIRTRQVDVTTESYSVAREYMVRVERDDFEGPALDALAKQTTLDADAFRRRFGRLVGVV